MSQCFSNEYCYTNINKNMLGEVPILEEGNLPQSPLNNPNQNIGLSSNRMNDYNN